MEKRTRHNADGTTYQVTYYSTTETAKLVRKALKETFPGIKFSVKSQKYAGGSSLSVRWLDGPTLDQVNKVVWQYEGAQFDGMTDMKTYVERKDGEDSIYYGADHILTAREFSGNMLRRAAQAIKEKYRCEVPGVVDPGEGHSARLELHGFNRVPIDPTSNGWLTNGAVEFIMEWAHETSCIEKPRIRAYPTMREVAA